MSNSFVKVFRIGICGLGALRRYHLKGTATLMISMFYQKELNES